MFCKKTLSLKFVWSNLWIRSNQDYQITTFQAEKIGLNYKMHTVFAPTKREIKPNEEIIIELAIGSLIEICLWWCHNPVLMMSSLITNLIWLPSSDIAKTQQTFTPVNSSGWHFFYCHCPTHLSLVPLQSCNFPRLKQTLKTYSI